MKNHRLMALILVMLMLFQAFPVLGAKVDDLTVFPCDDSYIVSGSRWEHKNYGNAGTMLFGSSYDRTALIKFDLSSIDLSAYNGALLNITFSAASETGKINVYAVNGDWQENKVTYANFPADYSFTVTSEISKGPNQRLSLTLNRALQQAKDTGSKTISIALKTDSGCISVFSSETSDSSLRPSLTLTEENAYIGGQMDFEWPYVTQEQIKAEMTKAIAKGHPYIIANKEKIEKIKEYAFGKDETYTKIYQSVKAKADEYLESDIERISVDITKASYIGVGQSSWVHVMNLALVYLVEGDERYAQRAYEQAEYFCKLDSWGTHQLIDNVQVAFCVGICYDWLYDWLNSEQKEVLVKGLRANHLDMMSDLYKNRNESKYKSAFYQHVFGSINHALMDNSCTLLAAMAVADADFDFMTYIMQASLNQLSKPFTKWYPDSAWNEGISYWGFAGPYTTRLLLAMKSAFGHCFGYEDIDCLLNVADYPIYMQSPEGSFIFGMTHLGTKQGDDPILYSMGKFKDDIGTMAYSLDNIDVNSQSNAVLALEFDPNLNYDIEIPLSKDKLFRSNDIVTMRNTHNGNQPIFGGMAVLANSEVSGALGSMNLGTLCLNALGEQWIMNPGKETYYTNFTHKEAPTVRWEYYRTRAEGLSCIVINPSEYGGQNIYAKAGVDVFESESGGAYAIADLTEGYKSFNPGVKPTEDTKTYVIEEDQAKSYKRGIMLADNRRTFVVQDEIVLTKPSEVYSFFSVYLPNGNIEILEDGKSAIIHKHNKKMYVSVDCDKEFTLSSMSSRPLPTSPVPPPDRPNTSSLDFMRLAIHFENIDSANIRVCFTPYLSEEELSAITCKEFVPMSEWTNQAEMKAVPMLEDIKIDGISLEAFNPYDRCFDVENELSISQVTPVYDNSKYDVSVKKDDETGAVNILVVDKLDSSNINSYSIAVPFVPVPSFVDTSGMSVLNIVDTKAPEPQAENNITNLYDNDLSTRWSGNGAGTVMTLTLDKPSKIGCVALNIMSGTSRRQYFDVSLSLDGKTWTDIGTFKTSGVTLDTEYFDLKNIEAQFVKITYNGASSSLWNSITELKLYGK